MIMIHDCFLYNDEIELLNIRLNLLSGFIDRFVIVWSPYTFTGLRKPDGFPYELPIVKTLSHRIEVIELVRVEGTGAWEREAYSRNALMKGLVTAAQDDIVLVSDIDEIPRPSSLKLLRDQGLLTLPVVFIQDYFNFKFNYQLIQGQQAVWPGPVAQRKAAISSPQELRSLRWQLMTTPEQSIDHAGWHFSFLTKSASVQRKLSHFSHQEADVQIRAASSVDELIFNRAGFHDHLHVGSVWALRETSSFGVPELEALIANYPDLIATGIADSDELIKEKVRWSIFRLSMYELPKLLKSYSVRALVGELGRRFFHGKH